MHKTPSKKVHEDRLIWTSLEVISLNEIATEKFLEVNEPPASPACRVTIEKVRSFQE